MDEYLNETHSRGVTILLRLDTQLRSIGRVDVADLLNTVREELLLKNDTLGRISSFDEYEPAGPAARSAKSVLKAFSR